MHLQADGAIGHDRADIAAADDAQRFAENLDAHERFFSHLPAWVEASAAGICRASANISAIACSAVVIELPNGVFITMTPLRGCRRNIDIVDADAGAANDFQVFVAFQDLGRDLGGGADGQTIEIADDRSEFRLVFTETGLKFDSDAAILENGDGRWRESI